MLKLQMLEIAVKIKYIFLQQNECDWKLYKTKSACQCSVFRWGWRLNAETQTWSVRSKPVPRIYSTSPWHFSWAKALSWGGWNRSGRTETVWLSLCLQRPWYGWHQREERGSGGASQEVRFEVSKGGTAWVMLGSQEDSDSMNKTSQTSHPVFLPTASLATHLLC